jgi:hypothetical protein
LRFCLHSCVTGGAPLRVTLSGLKLFMKNAEHQPEPQPVVPPPNPPKPPVVNPDSDDPDPDDTPRKIVLPTLPPGLPAKPPTFPKKAHAQFHA